jgi:hypothetical protein
MFMTHTAPLPDQTAEAPQGFRDALSELVQLGMRVARMVGRVAETETALAEAASQAAALAEQLEALDTEAGLGNRKAEEIIAAIRRDLELDPMRMILRSPYRTP